MKNFLIKTVKILAAIIFCFYQTFYGYSYSPLTARAESQYYRVLKEDVAFCTSPSLDTALFYLPYSYYVKKLDVSGEFYHVSCYSGSTPTLDGYVLISDLTPCQNENPPFLNFQITTVKATSLYTDNTLTDNLQFIFQNRTLNYYGKYYSGSGSVIFYVYYNKNLGFVEEEAVFPFVVPLQQDKLPTAKEDTTEKSVDKTDKTETALKSTVIVSIALSTAIIIALIVIPDKKEKSAFADKS